MPFTMIPLTDLDDVYSLHGHQDDEDTHEIYGLRGNDTISLTVPNGTFYVSGDAGNDTITVGQAGGRGFFEVDGGSGNDVITCRGGFGYFAGDGGDDRITASHGQFTLEGGAGNDTLTIGAAAEGILEGGAGNDTLIGDPRSLFIMYGGSGNDRLEAVGSFSTLHQEYNGDSGNDTILAAAGDDLLDGGSGRDVLRGGDGNDEMWGGDGADVFVFTGRSQPHTIAFRDVIMDADPEAGDQIQFVRLGLDFNHLTITQGDQGAEVQYTETIRGTAVVNTIVLVDVAATDLTAANFSFI